MMLYHVIFIFIFASQYLYLHVNVNARKCMNVHTGTFMCIQVCESACLWVRMCVRIYIWVHCACMRAWLVNYEGGERSVGRDSKSGNRALDDCMFVSHLVHRTRSWIQCPSESSRWNTIPCQNPKTQFVEIHYQGHGPWNKQICLCACRLIKQARWSRKKKKRSPSEREFSLVGKKEKTNPFFSHYDRWVI